MQTYYIFISHSWSYGDEYKGLCDLLNRPDFKWQDYSVPQDDPIHTSGRDCELEEAIERKIKRCSCVLVLAGVDASYSKWINKEIRIAKALNKKIIAVEKWGAERSSAFVKKKADAVVKWNAKSIMDAIIN